MWNELLPVGSVVLLKNSEKRITVMGFCQAKPDDTDTVYDYCGCLYPEGYIDADHVYLFNHEQVEKVYSLGYMDEEQFAFREKIMDILFQMKGGAQPDQDSTDGDAEEDQ